MAYSVLDWFVGGSRRIQLYERGMYNVNVELNFTYFV